VGAGGVVVGRYERGEMMSSIELAQRMADMFGVTLEFLVGEQGGLNLPSQSDMMESWSTLDTLSEDVRTASSTSSDSFIREAMTRQAFGAA